MNKFFTTLTILTTLAACGRDVRTYRYGKDGKDGKSIQGPQGEMGSVGDTGSQGDVGDTGADGQNGHSSLVDLVLPGDGGGASCLNGGATIVVGLDLDDDLVLGLTEITKSRDVCNGLDGAAGEDGLDAPVNPYAPVALVNPCNDAPGIFDEVFIRLSNGSLIASFSQNLSGLNTRLSVLVPGSYMTSDGDACAFTVDANNQITNENHTY